MNKIILETYTKFLHRLRCIAMLMSMAYTVTLAYNMSDTAYLFTS
jgi:hypothetical protein